jgi:hypothetical protein
MSKDKEILARLIIGMRDAYAKGENAMAWARDNLLEGDNKLISTLIAYDLQAGTYVDEARQNPEYVTSWCKQLAELVKPYLIDGCDILEVGVGEATTLSGVLNALNFNNVNAYGLDLSWSRILVGRDWSEEQKNSPKLFVGDLFNIPMKDNSIDIVYTSHSLEPNGGREIESIKELLRVARKAVILVEPCYELASEDAQQRMRSHGYVRGLKTAAESLGVNIVDYRLLDFFKNPLNPSGVMTLLKSKTSFPIKKSDIGKWQCPLTGVQLIDSGDYFYAESVGIGYPVLKGIPLLSPNHAVIASKLACWD